MGKKFRNMKIGNKLILSYAAIIVVFLISQVIALISMKNVSENMNHFYEEQYQQVILSRDMKLYLQGMAKNYARVAVSYSDFMTGTEAELLEYRTQKLNQLDSFMESYQSCLEQLDEGALGDSENLKTIQTQYTIVEELTDAWKELIEQGKVKEAMELANGDLDSAAYTMGMALDEITENAGNQADERFADLTVLSTSLEIICVVLSIFVIVVTILMAIMLIRSLTRPIAQMKQAAKQLADGNLRHLIPYQSQDELGQLADSLRSTMESLREYVQEIDQCMSALGDGKLNYQSQVAFQGDFLSIRESMQRIAQKLTKAMIQINTSADQVLCGAEQIAGSGQALSQATLEQASSVEELGATINDISERIQESAENAQATSRLTNSMGDKLKQSSQQMEELGRVIAQMKELGSRITGIVREIEDIAFQTNILSLNAAVEAARAGDAGRGFSVVANEIRRLSEKTSEASKSTRELMGETVNLMGEGASQAEVTSAQLQEAVEAAADSIQRVDMISLASNNQAAAIVQLRESIEQISDIVQENSATAEESAASSEELSEQMQMLKQLVASFEYEE